MDRATLQQAGTMNRRRFLAGAGGLALAAAANISRAQVPAGSRPNILMIITDQLAQRALGCYGDRYVESPNIDALARGGVRFSNAYTNCPLCQPSRASFWTGLYPSRTKVNSNGMNYPVPTIPRSMATLGEIFSEAGYETINFGKRHDAGSLRGFELVDVEDREIETPDCWPLNQDTTRDVDTTAKVVDWLAKPHTKPFFAVASLNNPHNICGWVGENKGVHEDVPLPPGVELPPLPDNFEVKDWEKLPLPVRYICCSHRRLRQATPWNETNYRHYLAAYYYYIKLVDSQIGRILDTLYASPEGSNTLVVFISDHGDGMGSHRMVTKQVSFYEEMTRIPIIVSGPGVSVGGRMVSRPLVSLVDLLPTFCDYAGLDAPRRLPGRSMMPWIRGEEPDRWHEYVVSEWHTEWGYTVSPGRMLRTERYKYIRYLEDGGEELYDLRDDPGEKVNLAGYGSSRKKLEEHRDMLREHTRAVRDPFFGMGVQVDKRWRSHEPGYPNHEGPCAPEAAWAEEERK